MKKTRADRTVTVLIFLFFFLLISFPFLFFFQKLNLKTKKSKYGIFFLKICGKEGNFVEDENS